jgi:hypothetical protein
MVRFGAVLITVAIAIAVGGGSIADTVSAARSTTVRASTAELTDELR